MEDKYLDFEKEVHLLSEKINSLREISGVDLSSQIEKLEKQKQKLVEKIFASITPWQTVQLARHQERPQTLDYINMVFDEFVELHGDRMFGDDQAIVAGIGKIGKTKVAFIGQQKGKDIEDRMKHNFGMPQPEGYRKALRVMRLAESFSLPIITFIDTPGAYPGVEAEERQQSIAIAENLMIMSDLQAPIISVVIGEGGSGGALAIGVCDRLLMLEYSVYSVISPEGCAAILWKDGSKADKASDILKMTAKDLCKLGIADKIIPEPLGGAHTNKILAGQNLRRALLDELDILGVASKVALRNKIKDLVDLRDKRLDFIDYVNITTKPMIKKK